MATKTAVLVDGGFYLKRAKSIRGTKSPQDRAAELHDYCMRHVCHEKTELYRVFYYDCDPINKKSYHPLLDRTIDLGKSDEYKWKSQFFAELAKKRKVAIRKGEQLDGRCEYVLKPDVAKDIVRGRKNIAALTERDFVLNVEQKGIDVRIGLDVALLAHERFVDQIVLITGDSDFVPAAKYARRHGLDFILDNMWHPVRDDLLTHVDGLYTPWKRNSTRGRSKKA